MSIEAASDHCDYERKIQTTTNYGALEQNVGEDGLSRPDSISK